ncbi:MAG: hypothetical protein ACLSBD_06440, partial [Blautia massiliensis (ex Durand et al. 2017)]
MQHIQTLLEQYVLSQFCQPLFHFDLAVIRTSADPSSVVAFLHRFIALYLRCRSAPTLILSAGAVPGKYTPFLYGRYEITEDLDRGAGFIYRRNGLTLAIRVTERST